MGELQNQMLRLMEFKNFSRKTISCYLMYMKEYVRYFGKSPDEMGQEQERRDRPGVLVRFFGARRGHIESGRHPQR